MLKYEYHNLLASKHIRSNLPKEKVLDCIDHAVGSLTSHRKRSGETITLAYDNLHRLTSRSYPTAADNVAFAYDLLGRRTQAKYADNSHTINYVWDGSPTPRPVARGSPTTTIRRPMQSA